jgi:hypothetical protein
MPRRNLYIFLAGLALTGYAWLGWNVVEGSKHSPLPSVCLFKEVTGIPCPSCGTTRSLLLLMNGDFRASLMMNPLGLLLAAALVVIPLWIAADVLRRSDSFFRRYVQMEQLLLRNKPLAAAAAALVALNWFWNIAKGL